jgi:GcrA cell cycle regulator
MVQSMSELHDLRRRVREAEASFAKAKRLRHDGLLPDGVEKHFEVKPVARPTRVGAEKKIMAKKSPSLSGLNVIEPPLEMRPCSLLELNETDCHWPLGEVHQVAVLFCGANKGPGFPYCGHHLRMAQG